MVPTGVRPTSDKPTLCPPWTCTPSPLACPWGRLQRLQPCQLTDHQGDPVSGVASIFTQFLSLPEKLAHPKTHVNL